MCQVGLSWVSLGRTEPGQRDRTSDEQPQHPRTEHKDAVFSAKCENIALKRLFGARQSFFGVRQIDLDSALLTPRHLDSKYFKRVFYF